MSRPAKAELTKDEPEYGKSPIKVAEEQLTTYVYNTCAISACNAPAIPRCFIETPVIAGELHRIFYCVDCFEAYIRPWARNPANNDKVFNRIG